MKFDTIHSLGSRCHNSDILKKYNYREFAGFFDFMNTQKIETLNHILSDNFNEILKKENNYRVVCNHLTYDPETKLPLEQSIRTTNKFYNTNVHDVHSAIFPHHDLENQIHYDHFVRCKGRFKKLVNYNVLFNYTYNIWENDITLSDIQKMIDTLKKTHNFKNFKICFIGIKIGPIRKYEKIENHELYDVWELIISNHSYTGGIFSDDESNENYINIIKSYEITNNRVSKEEIDRQ